MDELIAFDIETTGLYAEQGDRIIEIGAVPVVGSEVLLAQGFSELINPGIPISPEVSTINGITDEMVKDAPDLKTVLPVFLHYIENKPLIAHNASFDVGFISYYMGKTGLPLLRNRIIDTLELSRKAFPRASAHNLDALLKRLHISYENEQRHRSLGDAYLTGLAYVKLTKRIDS
jgi:DNA polymerase-3 subunit alpha (Gram-positive type)